MRLFAFTIFSLFINTLTFMMSLFALSPGIYAGKMPGTQMNILAAGLLILDYGLVSVFRRDKALLWVHGMFSFGAVFLYPYALALSTPYWIIHITFVLLAVGAASLNSSYRLELKSSFLLKKWGMLAADICAVLLVPQLHLFFIRLSRHKIT